MRFFDRGQRRESVRGSVFHLTEQGRAKLQSEFTGDPQSRVLVALETSGSSMSFNELSRQTYISGGHLEHLLHILEKRGYIASGHQMEL